MRLKIPSPLAIALTLSAFVFFCAWVTTSPEGNVVGYGLDLLDYWYSGFWSLTGFTMQMVMILVLGHMLALSPVVERFAFWFIKRFDSGPKATAAVALATLLVSFLNWGLGLIFGAVLARKMGEYAKGNQMNLNYPLVGAAGYCGLMFWHGGLSGSAPLAVAKEGHHLVEELGVISTSSTIFSSSNMLVVLCMLVLLPAVVWWLAKRGGASAEKLLPTAKTEYKSGGKSKVKLNGLMLVFGIIMVLFALVKWMKVYSNTGDFFGALNLDFINFGLFGLVLIFMSNLQNFQVALDDAVLSASGILVQFPLYAGTMGIMKDSGLMVQVADWFVAISDENTFPLFTFISAGVVNLFVPSGGGQWMVQGPVIVEAANALKVPYEKCIMALSYGDELTNMIQPFWALPLLGITGLKARDLLPYTAKLMLVGLAVYGAAVLLF